MSKVEMQMGETEYRLVIDGDDGTEFVPYGEECVVQHAGQTYWSLAAEPPTADEITEWPVYVGKEVAGVSYEEVTIEGETEDTEVEVETE